MKTFENCAAQGDLLITRINALPGDLVASKADENGDYVVAHSETMHNHVVAQEGVDFYQSANDEFVAFLVVAKNTVLRHLRSFDTHAPIEIKEGVYRINRQREYTPEGYRRAAD